MTLSELLATLEQGDRVILPNDFTVCMRDGRKVLQGLVTVIGSLKSTTIYIDMDSNISYPPVGQLKVTNLYVDKATRKLSVSYDDTPSKR